MNTQLSLQRLKKSNTTNELENSLIQMKLDAEEFGRQIEQLGIDLNSIKDYQVLVNQSDSLKE